MSAVLFGFVVLCWVFCGLMCRKLPLPPRVVMQETTENNRDCLSGKRKKVLHVK